MTKAARRTVKSDQRALGAVAFAEIDDDGIDSALQVAQDVAAWTASHLPADGGRPSDALMKALRDAVEQRALLAKLQATIETLERQWLVNATADSAAAYREQRRLSRARTELNAQLSVQQTRVRKMCNEALAQFDAWWVQTDRRATTPAATATLYEQKRAATRQGALWWRRLLRAENTGSIYVSIALGLLVPSVSFAMWRHTFDSTLTPFFAQLRAGYAALAPLVVAIGVPLIGSLLREHIKKTLGRPVAGVVLVAVSVITSVVVFWNALQMQRFRFRCSGAGLDIAKIVSTVDGIVQPLCSEGELWLNPASSVDVRAPGFRVYYKSIVTEIPTSKNTGEGIVREIQMLPIRPTFRPVRDAPNVWSVSFSLGKVTSNAVNLHVTARPTINGRAWTIRLRSGGCRPQLEPYPDARQPTRTIDFPPGCFETSDPRVFEVVVDPPNVTLFPFTLLYESRNVEQEH